MVHLVCEARIRVGQRKGRGQVHVKNGDLVNGSIDREQEA